MMNDPPISLRDWLAYCGKNGCRGKNLVEMGRLWKRVHRESGPFIVKYKNYVMRQKFMTRREAEAWARWNYKGKTGWRIYPAAGIQTEGGEK